MKHRLSGNHLKLWLEADDHNVFGRFFSVPTFVLHVLKKLDLTNKYGIDAKRRRRAYYGRTMRLLLRVTYTQHKFGRNVENLNWRYFLQNCYSTFYQILCIPIVNISWLGLMSCTGRCVLEQDKP